MCFQCLTITGQRHITETATIQEQRKHSLQIAVMVFPSQAILLRQHFFSYAFLYLENWRKKKTVISILWLRGRLFSKEDNFWRFWTFRGRLINTRKIRNENMLKISENPSKHWHVSSKIASQINMFHGNSSKIPE